MKSEFSKVCEFSSPLLTIKFGTGEFKWNRTNVSVVEPNEITSLHQEWSKKFHNMAINHQRLKVHNIAEDVWATLLKEYLTFNI